MNESLQAQWPSPDSEFSEHVKYMKQGIAVIHDHLIVPEDKRYETAYYLLVTGRGQKSSVEALGDGGTGKTVFGDLMMGGDQRVEISRDDNDDTLYGFPNPINPGEIVPGKMKGLVPGNPTAWLNEVSHLPNTGALHRLWDLGEIFVNGQTVRLGNIAIYMSSNFPDGRRVHEHDEAFRSRIAVEMLTGDYTKDKASELQDLNAVRIKDSEIAPILPDAQTRQAIGEHIRAYYPVPVGLGKFIVSIVDDLNRSGLIVPVNPGDARIGEALYDTARARMLLDQEEAKTELEPKHIARVSALVLPTVVRLSHSVKASFMETAGRRPSNLEQAIAIRHLIAKTAFTQLCEVVPVEQPSKYIEKNTDKYRYANIEATPVDIDKVVSKKSGDPEEAEKKDGKRRFRLGRKAR